MRNDRSVARGGHSQFGVVIFLVDVVAARTVKEAEGQLEARGHVRSDPRGTCKIDERTAALNVVDDVGVATVRSDCLVTISPVHDLRGHLTRDGKAHLAIAFARRSGFEFRYALF